MNNVEEYCKKYIDAYHNSEYSCGFKNVDSVIEYVNVYTQKMLRLKNEDVIVGLKDEELPGPVSELSDIFVNQDRQVILTKQPLQYVGLHQYAPDEWSIHIAEKKPILDAQGNVQKILCLTKDIDLGYLKLLVSNAKHFDCKQQTIFNINSIPNFSTLCEDISEKQLECLYFFLRGYTTTEIANIYCRSHRTIEAHMQALKRYFGVSTRAQLYDLAIATGLMYYIPRKVLGLKLKY